MARTEAHRGPSYSGGSSASGTHRGPQPSSMGGSPPSKERGRDEALRSRKKKKKVYKRTIPRYGTQGYSSNYSDPRTKKKVVDLGSSI